MWTRIAVMLDDFARGFSLFAILISSNMAKIFLFIGSLGDGCTQRITQKDLLDAG